MSQNSLLFHCAHRIERTVDRGNISASYLLFLMNLSHEKHGLYNRPKARYDEQNTGIQSYYPSSQLHFIIVPLPPAKILFSNENIQTAK